MFSLSILTDSPNNEVNETDSQPQFAQQPQLTNGQRDHHYRVGAGTGQGQGCDDAVLMLQK